MASTDAINNLNGNEWQTLRMVSVESCSRHNIYCLVPNILKRNSVCERVYVMKGEKVKHNSQTIKCRKHLIVGDISMDDDALRYTLAMDPYDSHFYFILYK